MPKLSKIDVSLRSFFFLIDRIQSIDIRPARDALKLVGGKFKQLIPTQ
jgi:hypothetical protein